MEGGMYRNVFRDLMILTLSLVILGVSCGFCAGRNCDKFPSVKLEWPDGGVK